MRKEILERVLDLKRRNDQRRDQIEKEILDFKSKLERLEFEKTDLNKQLERIEFLESPDAAHLSQGARSVCPDCYVKAQRDIPLKPIPSDTDEDLLRCSACGLEVTLFA